MKPARPLTILLLFAGAGLIQRLNAQHSDTQKVILENEFVRVLDIRVPPGVLEPEHSHARGVTIAMSDYDNETKSLPEGKVGRGHTKFGEVKWAEPVTHEARNTGTTEQHVIRIELKKDAPSAADVMKPGPLDALVACPDTDKLIFENAYVRAIAERVPAGTATAKHSHMRGLMINVSSYENEATMPFGKSVKVQAKAGDVGWSSPLTHELKITGSVPANIVWVEVK